MDWKNLIENGLILILKHLELFSDNVSAYQLINEEEMLDIKIMMWVIKDIYISPHKVLLNNLNLKKLNFRYLKAKKYISKKEEYSLCDLINYFAVCLMDELEEGRIKQC